MNRILIIISLLIFVSNCQIEEAKPIKGTELTIASTFLSKGDSTLFSAWSYRNNVSVKIIPLTRDQIKDTLLSKPYSSGIDIILTDNLFDLYKLNNSKKMQSLFEFELTDFDSEEHRYITLGIDLYIFVSYSDSIKTPKTYNDLLRHNFKCGLNSTEEIPMLSAIFSRMNKAETFEWFNKYEKHKAKDSVTFELNRLSHTKDKKAIIKYPGQRVSGTIYNVTSASIVHQSPNYHLAVKFMEHFRSPENNSKLCTKLGLIPVANPEEFRFFRENAGNLIQYYGMIERMLRKKQ